MSGPKSSSYELDRERLRKERVNQERLKRVRRLEDEIETLRARTSMLCQQLCLDEVKDSPKSNSEKDLKTHRDRLKASVSELEAKASQDAADNNFAERFSSIINTPNTVRRLNSDDSKKAETLRDSIACISSPEAEQVRAELDQVIETDNPLSADLCRRAQELERAADDNSAGQIAMEALEHLGYEVDGEFNTLFVEGGMLNFQKSGWGDYFVRMRVNTEEGFINFNMVRAGQVDDTSERRNRDREMEASWCSGYPALLDEMRAHGIKCGAMRALEPGAVAVQAVPPETLGVATSASARVHTTKLKERTL